MFSKRGIEEIISEKSFNKRLESGKKLRIKFGVDPTSTDIHIGHAVALRILKQFQDMGHTVIFLIGDYTARVGDPSGKNKTRPVLSSKDIEVNIQTYLDQVGKVLDAEKSEIRRNSEWFSKMNFNDLIKLGSNFSVASIIERDDFEKRIKNNQEISMHELFYPMMQAYDSVMLKADVELGGTDQRFNMLAGRSLQKKVGQVPQEVIMAKLLVGTDGVEKMSKSLGNYIGVTDKASDIYGKVMSICDEQIINYLLLCTDVSEDEVEKIKIEMTKGKNPRDYKMRLAQEIVAIYHNKEAAVEAEKAFVNQFSKGNVPDEMPELKASGEINVVDLVAKADRKISKSEVRRLIEQGAVSIDNQKVNKIDEKIKIKSGTILKVGKRRYWKIR